MRVDQREVVGWDGGLVLGFERADGFQLLGRKGEQTAQLTDRSDGVLRLPSPVVPVVIWNIAPERVAPGLTGRFFVVVARGFTGNTARLQPGSLFRFAHRLTDL